MSVRKGKLGQQEIYSSKKGGNRKRCLPSSSSSFHFRIELARSLARERGETVAGPFNFFCPLFFPSRLLRRGGSVLQSWVGGGVFKIVSPYTTPAESPPPFRSNFVLCRKARENKVLSLEFLSSSIRKTCQKPLGLALRKKPILGT